MRVTSSAALWGGAIGPMTALAAVGAAAQAPAAAQTGGSDWVSIIGVAGIIVTLLALAGMGLRRWWRSRTAPWEDPTPPLITIPQSPGLKVTPVAPWREERSSETLPVPAPPAPSPPVPTRQPTPPVQTTAVAGGGNGSSVQGELVEGSTVRFYRPPDGTLQLLPGRLEIVAGEEIPHDIRFIRARGEEPEVTFGRSDGPPHRHVQLNARTVSRQHARMRFAERRWQIENLSETNPVVINGKELDSGDGGYVLKEGDRIEMGEVVFLFRER